jgi:hypothetical protein
VLKRNKGLTSEYEHLVVGIDFWGATMALLSLFFVGIFYTCFTNRCFIIPISADLLLDLKPTF